MSRDVDDEWVGTVVTAAEDCREDLPNTQGDSFEV